MNPTCVSPDPNKLPRGRSRWAPELLGVRRTHHRRRSLGHASPKTRDKDPVNVREWTITFWRSGKLKLPTTRAVATGFERSLGKLASPDSPTCFSRSPETKLDNHRRESPGLGNSSLLPVREQSVDWEGGWVRERLWEGGVTIHARNGPLVLAGEQVSQYLPPLGLFFEKKWNIPPLYSNWLPYREREKTLQRHRNIALTWQSL